MDILVFSGSADGLKVKPKKRVLVFLRKYGFIYETDAMILSVVFAPSFSVD